MKIPKLRNRFPWLVRFFGFAVLAVLLWRIDLSETARLLARVRPGWYAASILAIPTILFIKSFRWEMLLRRQGIGLGLGRAVRLYMAAMMVGVLTPGRVGDFVKVLYLRRLGHSMGRSLWSPLLDRVSDLVVFLLFGLWGLAYFSMLLPDDPLRLLLLTAFVTVLLFLGFLAARKLLGGGLANLAERFSPRRYKEEARRSAEEFSGEFRLLGPSCVAGLLLLGLLGFAVQFLQAWLVARALSIQIDFAPLAACVAIMTLVVLVPVSIQGIGTRDAAVLFLFAALGLSAPQALAFSAVTLANNVVAALICLGPYLAAGRERRLDLEP